VPKTQSDEVTELLVRLSGGSRDALDQLLPLVYDELRSLAAGYLRREQPDHTLQLTALVHEAWLKLIDDSQINLQNRAHFFGIAAQVMRRVLVDHARRQMADKRGGGIQKLSLNENLDAENLDAAHERAAELIALDDAMQELASFDPQKGRIVELRFFGGLSVEETAQVLGVSAVTIKRQWRMAKAWLYGKVNRS